MTNELRHTPKLRLLSAFLAAAMTLTTLPAAAFAADVTDYELAVNGKRVTSANATNILDDGKASYDAVTRTLTLSGDISVTDNAVNPFGKQLTVTGKSTVTGAQRDRYAGFYSGGEAIKVAADADITLDTFGFGINAMGADISGNMKICNAEYGVNGMGATVESGGKLIIQNAENAVSGGGANVYGTLEIDGATAAVNDGGVTVHKGGVVTVTGADSGLNGGSTVDGGSLSVSATTCIDNGEVIFKSGTLKLDSTNNETIALNKLTVNAPNFWYRTAKDGAWTSVTGGSWTRPDGAAYFEITTDDPAATHYTVTFDLNGGTNWGKDDEWIKFTGGKWNNDHDQVSFTTQTGDKGECLNVPLMDGMGPERKDYKFVGWYTAAVGGEPVEEQSYYASNQHLELITDNITLYAHWQWNGEGPEPDPVPDEPVIGGGDGSGFGAVLAVAGGAAVVGAAGFGIYELATRAILKDLLPEGTAIPATRGELALLLWQNAGRPEPAALPAFADTADTETAKAAQWCTEQGLLTTEDGAFHPEQKVTKYRVIRIWKQAAAPQQ